MDAPEPKQPDARPADKANRTTLWLVAGFGTLLLLVLIFAAQRGGNQDRLGDGASLTLPDAEEGAAGCTGNAIVTAIKLALFEAAAQGRPGDAAAFRQVAGAAVGRMENAALEAEDGDRLACSGSLAIDLPPGIVASGGRRHLMGNVDYSVARGGATIEILSAATLVNALADLARSSNGISSPIGEIPPDDAVEDPLLGDVPGAEPAPSPGAPGPSFDCSRARTRGEQIVCSDPGLASLDRQMDAQFQRAMAASPPDRQALLRQTRDRFLGFRDRCPDAACVADAYQGRMREISDILAGRWQPPR